jgi:O-antigen chain-terminating methyltransferase
VENGLTRLTSRVRAEPYTSDPDALRLEGPDGAPRMGYAGDPGQAYADFEELFRGTSESVAAAMEPYVPMLAGRAPIVDLGCGRGEMLAVLRDHGIAAYGVDIDDGMLALAKSRDLDVRREDLLEHLGGLADGSVGAIVSMQVIEHLPVDALRALFGEALRVLAPDGVCIFETVNPHAVDAFKSFWLDLTHVRPLYPESLLMLAREVGFPAAEIVFPQGSGDLDRDLDEQGAYAVVAYRSAPRPTAR